MITGSMVALITPMTSTGDIDWPALRKLVDFHLQEGTNAIVAVGTTGESATLSVSEHCMVIKHVVDQINGRIPVIAGTGANSPHEAIELTEAARVAGVDACLLVTPYYNKPTQEGLFQFHKLIAESVSIPQILYNVPGRTACDMQNDTVDRLASINNIIGIKDATGDLDRGRDLIARCSDRIAIYSGDDPTAMELMLAGGKGDISVTANVAPKLMAQMCAAAIAGDRERAQQLDNQLLPLHSSLFLESNPIPTKWALYEMGMITEGIRLPLTVFSEALRPQLKQAMQQSGIIQ
ncbi:4-hydroxy-tetrahydrodipicolinate synthase [Oceanicoccus sp. KOV_DT_Chl]|uniref:4-hydroxy-tetrahydrodipicolinate synthase n=1 Tax=Oceanicoccus sp. KOV_DT_Chl TaxID=1904639 RepID=UPI000C796855|nr:4-hydroxy-tetrahydrodipicolinate synthase [Oceanicoccus sp. KOV_DT_Chl]